MRLIFMMLTLSSFFTACFTTRSDVEAGPCFCGVIKPDPEKEPVCAVWSMNWNKSERQEVLDFKKGSNCSLKDCEDDLSQKACTDYQAWLEPVPEAPANDEPCYCDFVRVNHPQGEVACAIWKEGDKKLREYQFIAECNPTACEKQFSESAFYCKNKFQPFYNAPDISRLLPFPLSIR